MSKQNSQIASRLTTESPLDWEYYCPNCDRGFNADMAYQIVLANDTEAELMCTWCKHTSTYEAPAPKAVKRPPAIVNDTIVTNDEERTTARLFFEGGAWLQYREASDGWVHEEMFNADGEQIESFTPDFEVEDCDPATAYLHRTKTRYKKLTVRGLRIQHPHIAAVLLDGH